jgi:ABC-type glycerol-3-phosphate transport system substrate-binding protein
MAVLVAWIGLLGRKFMTRKLGGLPLAGGLLLGMAAIGVAPAQAEDTLKVCYMSHPVIEANVAMMEKWAKASGVELEKNPMSYSVYLPKMSQMLSSGGADCDIFWHNDDWGQLWKQWVEQTSDVAGMDKIRKGPMRAFPNDEGQPTAVPLAHTVGTFFYRTDLVDEKDVPKTWADMVAVGHKLQEEGKTKWGYVGGMTHQNTWFSIWWSLWTNGCDIFNPKFERDNAVLDKSGWVPTLTEDCHRETIEFWWDNLHKDKISPEAMISYGRNEANAIFMAGESAFTFADSTFWGQFNDPEKSKIAGKVGMALWPMGPRLDNNVAWDTIWAWGIPKAIDAKQKDLAKKALGAMLLDHEGQIAQWKSTGGPPPNTDLWPELAAQDPVFAKLKAVVFDVKDQVLSAYYFPNWPAVQKAYADISTEALSGKREDIPAVLERGMKTLHDAAVQQIAK